MGKLVQVEIIESTKFSMIGKLVEDEIIIDPKINSTTPTKMKQDNSFQGSIFYKLSMFMLVMACLIRVYHIFQVKYGHEKNK